MLSSQNVSFPVISSQWVGHFASTAVRQASPFDLWVYFLFLPSLIILYNVICVINQIAGCYPVEEPAAHYQQSHSFSFLWLWRDSCGFFSLFSSQSDHSLRCDLCDQSKSQVLITSLTHSYSSGYGETAAT